jgi:hypothetical protein
MKTTTVLQTARLDLPERETTFRGFPAIVFGINREQRNGR